MKHHQAFDTQASQHILSIEPGDVPPFIGRCLKERTLSTLVAHLNHDVLDGTPKEQDDARRALELIGFI
ncbi:hypothetical protein [Roseobacter ponti]|uniref:Uncharacterized protein n=1 Tax=Roseobacter ponti TaxID=1891787 RepID=A0A858T022_9RHOB|nr:hypothetical protein [Roseobacter ponti]QJF52516.1 hypothetical protein G3256_15715 [Roseobacter ponti]